MKRISTLIILLCSVLLFGCSKDFLKSYDNRIVGTWHISNVNRVGFGGSTDNLAFTHGTFTFFKNGSLTYVNDANVSYKGSWDISIRHVDDEKVQRLQITAIGFTSQEVLSEFYDDINFTGTNHFKANVVSAFHTYVTHFQR